CSRRPPRPCRRLPATPHIWALKSALLRFFTPGGPTFTRRVPVHWVPPDGGVSRDGTQWRSCRRRFLFAVKALGSVFRGKYLAGLERLRRQRRLTFAGASAAWAEEAAWSALRQHLQA